MTVGNVISLRQTNIVRLFVYSSVAQASFILAPLAMVMSVPGDAQINRDILTAVVAYLLYLLDREPGCVRGDHRRVPQDP